MKNSIKVSILSITYNQSDYIREALDSFIVQKTNFKFEVIVHDDASTDGTKEILEEYQKKYPEIIKPVYEKENQYSKENFEFITDMYKSAKGDYIAFCEGDDFWTDENKLQIQVDKMEKNPKASICFHQVNISFEANEESDEIWPSKDGEFTVRRLLKENFIQTNSVLYRRQDYSTMKSDIMPGDWYAHLYHARFGEIIFIGKPMSTYRRHEGGVWWDSHKNLHKIWIKYGLKFLKFDEEIIRLYGGSPEYRAAIESKTYNDIRSLAQVDIDHNTELIVGAIENYPELMHLYTKMDLLEDNKLKEEAGIPKLELESLKFENKNNKTTINDLSDQLKILQARLELIEESRTWRLRARFVRLLRKEK
jgi:glycosyltransferase involved in cell wall biosynthesis